jgi:hypothetical protein
MALVVIQVQDMPDGSVGVNLVTEPRIVGPKAKFTEAEKLGAVALNAIHTELESLAGPKLILAGADEMPH